jgi:hypothetical protein
MSKCSLLQKHKSCLPQTPIKRASAIAAYLKTKSQTVQIIEEKPMISTPEEVSLFFALSVCFLSLFPARFFASVSLCFPFRNVTFIWKKTIMLNLFIFYYICEGVTSIVGHITFAVLLKHLLK